MYFPDEIYITYDILIFLDDIFCIRHHVILDIFWDITLLTCGCFTFTSCFNIFLPYAFWYFDLLPEFQRISRIFPEFFPEKFQNFFQKILKFSVYIYRKCKIKYFQHTFIPSS